VQMWAQKEEFACSVLETGRGSVSRLIDPLIHFGTVRVNT